MKKYNGGFLIILSVISFLTFFMPNNSFCQSYRLFRSELDEILERSKWRIGPFRIYPMIQFRQIGYDDNVYQQREEDKPKSDFRATISPFINIYLLFRNWVVFSLTENPEYVYFAKEGRERSLNNNFSPQLKLLLFQRFVLSCSYQYNKTRRRATSEFDIRANIENKSYNASIFYETARGTSFGISGVIRKIRFEDILFPDEEILLSRAFNREEQSGNFEFYYRIRSESFLFIHGGYTEYNFENIEARWRDSYSYQIYTGIRFPVLGNVRGTVSLGYKKLDSKRVSKKGFSGLVGNTSLDIRIRRFGFRFLYDRDCRFSYWTNNIFFLEDNYGAGISFYLTQFLRLDYDFSYGRSNYPEATTVRMSEEEYEEIKRRDSNYTHTFGFVIRVIRRTGIGIMTNFWERKSNMPVVGRDRWFVGGYVTYEF